MLATAAAFLASYGLSALNAGALMVQPAGAESPPMVGFSFSPVTAAYFGDSSVEALTTLMDTLKPDLVRLPVFWDRAEVVRDRFDYSELDDLLEAVRQHNARFADSAAQVVLVVGARNFGYPEVHAPAWMPIDPGGSIASLLASRAYSTYFQTTVSRYANEKLVAAWQVENEALDDAHSPVAASTSVPAEELKEEIDTVHRLAQGTPVLVTTFNNSTLSLDLEQISAPNSRKYDHSGYAPVGHPLSTIQLADVLGMDAYVATASTSMADATVAKRIAWKTAALQYWAGEAAAASRPMWITEMQGEDWPGASNFSPADLIRSAREYRKVGASAVLLWGAEGWLHSAAWMNAGTAARAILGSRVRAS
ncbi:MAG: hypothetical protein ABR573_11120 [Candidatus Dormibacteria bacterium]